MPYTPIAQRPIGMKPQVNFKAIDTTERLTIPSFGGTALSTQATILPKKGAEMMKFPEAYPGAVSGVVQRLGPAPGIGVKVPFMQKEVRFTEQVPLLKQQVKWAVEVPEKIITSLKEIPYTIAEKTTPEYKGKIYRVPSYQEDSLNMTKSLMDLGYSPAEAVTAAVLQTGGQAIIDVTIVAGLLESGARAVAKNINPTLEERVAAWKTLNRPATAEELSKNKISISRIFSPESYEARTAGTANEAALRELNNAEAILKKGGIPTQADLLKIRISPMVKAFAAPETQIFTRTAAGKIKITSITDIIKPSPELAKMGGVVMPRELPGLPQLPGYAPITERPAFGLRGMEIEKVKPVGKGVPKAEIPKELEPLVVEARKYKSAEEFDKAIKKGIKLKNEELPKNIQTAKRVYDNARQTGYSQTIWNAEENLQKEIAKANIPLKEKPFGQNYALDNNGDVILFANDVKSLQKGIYEPTILERKVSDIKKEEVDGMIKQIQRRIKEKSISEIVGKEKIQLLKEIKNPISLTDFYTQATKETKEVKPIPKELEPKDTIKVFRATKTSYNPTKITDVGISVGKSVEDAEYFGMKGGFLEELYLDKNVRILKDIPNRFLSKPKGWVKGDWLKVNEDSVVKYAREKGYDAIEFRPEINQGIAEIRVLNPDVLTKGIKEVKPEITKPAIIPKAPKTLDAIITQEAKQLMAMEEGLKGGMKIGAEGLEMRVTEHSPAYSAFYKEHGYGPKSLENWKQIAERELEAGKSVTGQIEAFRATKGAEKPAVKEIDVEEIFKEIDTTEKMDRLVNAQFITEQEKSNFIKTLSSDLSEALEKARGLTPVEGRQVAKAFEEYVKTSGIKERMITLPETRLLKMRIQAEARGSRLGFRVARTLTRVELIAKFKSSQVTIKELKDEVIKRIKENLPTETRGRFLQTLVKDLTRKRVYGIYERIERISEQIKRREIVGELKEVPKGNIAVDYQIKIEETMKDIDLVKPTERTLQKLQGLSEYIKREGIPLGINIDTLNKLDRLSKKNVSQMTMAELTDLQDTIRTLQQLGKLKLQLKFKYNQRERAIALQKLLDSTTNLDPPVTPIMGRLGQWDMAKVQTRRIYMETVHIPRVADIIDGYKGYEGENAKYIKRLGAKETIAKVETQETIIGALEEIQKLGVKELTPDQQTRMMINIRIREGAYDQAKTLMEKSKMTEVPTLTDTENKVIEIIHKAVNKSTDEIAAISEEIENKPFRRIPEYTLPIKYEYEYNIIPSQTIEQGRHRVTQTFKGFVYNRQKGVEKMPRTDILGIFEEAINEQQWYIKIQPELENLRYLVRSKEYVAKGGQMVANFWKDYMDVVARRGWSAMATSNPLLRAARINMGRSILGYKLTSILMQPFSVFDAIAYANTRFGGTASLQVLKEFSKSWVNPRYARQIIAESPALQMRKAGEVAIEELAPGLVAKPARGIEKRMPGVVRTTLRKFQKEALTLLQDFDIRTAAGTQKAIENILVKNGIPNAKQEAEFFMNITQGSSEVTYRPMILSRGEGSRTLFTFQTFFLNRWGMIAHDLITSGLIKNKRWGKKFAALIGLAIMMAASVAEQEARYAILGLTKKTKRKASMWVSALMAIPENIPIFGNMISSFVTYGTTDFDFPLARVVENAIGGIGVITKKTEEAKIMAGLRAAESFAELLGIAGSAQFFDFLEGIFGGEKEGSKMMPMPTKKGGGRPPLIMPKKLNIMQPQLEDVITNLIKKELA